MGTGGAGGFDYLVRKVLGYERSPKVAFVDKELALPESVFVFFQILFLSGIKKCAVCRDNAFHIGPVLEGLFLLGVVDRFLFNGFADQVQCRIDFSDDYSVQQLLSGFIRITVAR